MTFRTLCKARDFFNAHNRDGCTPYSDEEAERVLNEFAASLDDDDLHAFGNAIIGEYRERHEPMPSTEPAPETSAT